MKKLILPALLGLIVAVSSCKDEALYTQEMNNMRDSIFQAYPTTVASISMQVEDKTRLKVVLGGNNLYASANEKKEQMANDLGAMAVRIFGKDSYLKTGILIITKDERNTSLTPADGVSANMDIEAMKK